MENREPEQFGKYTVLELLGFGGMAEVFKCKLTGVGGFEKIMVVKRILARHAEDPEFLNMFLDEARVAANLQHPNILQTFDIDVVNGMPYIAMEYIHGPSLSALLWEAKRQGRNHLGHSAKIIAGLCAGLHYAHNARDAQGQPLHIVHRDVSAENVIVGLDGVPKLLDFGVAMAAGRRAATQVGMLKGKLEYLAPEQLRREPIDHRADVFGAGVCLYLASVGKLPFEGDSEAAVMEAVVAGRYALPSTLIPGFPAELERIIVWALQNDVQQRCPTAEALHDALEAFVAQGEHASSAKDVAAWIGKIFPNARESNARLGAYGVNRTLRSSLTGRPITSAARIRPTAAPSGAGGGRRVALWTVAALAVVLAASAAVGVWLWSTGRVPAPSGAPQVDQRASSTARVYLESAEIEERARNFKLAQELLEKARAASAGDPELDVRIAKLADRLASNMEVSTARTLLQAKDYDGAIQAATRALERAADNPAAQELLEAALREKEKTEASPPLPPPVDVAAKGPAGKGKRAAVGTLTVLSTPSGMAFIDGAPVGRTPIYRRPMKEGRYALEVREAGFTTASRNVAVQPGKEASVTLALATVAPLVQPPPRVEPPPLPPPKEAAVAPGTMDPELTRRAVQKQIGAVQACFERAQMDDPSLAGRITLQISISGQGKATGAKVAHSTLGSSRAEACIVDAVKSWSFPAPAGGVPTEITYPFILK